MKRMPYPRVSDVPFMEVHAGLIGRPSPQCFDVSLRYRANAAGLPFNRKLGVFRFAVLRRP